jgi:hypothetical protein
MNRYQKSAVSLFGTVILILTVVSAAWTASYSGAEGGKDSDWVLSQKGTIPSQREPSPLEKGKSHLQAVLEQIEILKRRGPGGIKQAEELIKAVKKEAAQL